MHGYISAYAAHFDICLQTGMETCNALCNAVTVIDKVLSININMFQTHVNVICGFNEIKSVKFNIKLFERSFVLLTF